MSENGKYGEMLPIPPALLTESEKNIGVVEVSGQVLDLNQQGTVY